MGNAILERVVREEISEEVMFRQGSELSDTTNTKALRWVCT